jgi:hypothetical protein
MALGWSLLDPVTGSGGAPACALVESALGKVSTAQTRKRILPCALEEIALYLLQEISALWVDCNRGDR